MKSEDDIRYCKTDGIPNEYLINPKLAEEAREKQSIKINNLNDFITPKQAFGKFPDITDMSGYEAPIKMYISQMETKMEADTMSIIQRYGIDVDKEELIKALNYDRGQYEKGYRDAQSKLKPLCKYLTKCMSHPDISREYHDWCGLYGEDCNCQCCSR